MKNKTFDTLRFIANIWAPLATFIVAVLPVFGVADVDVWTKILAAVTVFLNSLVEALRRSYNDGAQDGGTVE